MMINLESKLKKENLIESFNANVIDLVRRGVIKWVDELPGIENLQRSLYTSDIHIDTGLNKADFKVKQWVITGEK